MTTTTASKCVLVRHPQVMPQLVQTLDSPAGLAAFIYDKFNDWTYSGWDAEKVLRRDEMLDDVTLYRLTNTAASSGRLYWDQRRMLRPLGGRGTTSRRTDAPKLVQLVSQHLGN